MAFYVKKNLWGFYCPLMVCYPGSQLGVADRMLDILVTNKMLNGSRVLPIVGQLKAGRVTQHVRMDREGNSCLLSGPGYNPADSRMSQRTFSFGYKYIF